MTAADFDQVRALAVQAGLKQEDLPDFANNVITKRVIEDRPGEIVCAAVARIELMSHLYLDHDWSTPMMRFEAFKLLQREMVREIGEKGIEIVHAQVESKAFRRRLRMLGWESPENEPLLLKI